ncbi:hypothetical protein ENUP19_0252G0101 [Entamoeba nuttalli]|uniref:Leucine rich repeat protein, BspA family protein n=2 Tax=Entamoeba nuttalli TaxID=412467 RepID=K2G9W7_ENTNP|nr:leucine rich repeat protein, BspA family protein [Entamoeba nuttalli P19]EKE39226.1 leucine rich repeat protein, BspA family protein [Entamoeba nuttalli P19]|eukprot:XP_008858423.1 leucine rich repeat protein, BspA family protein [Entamoeba nuttalli P19]
MNSIKNRVDGYSMLIVMKYLEYESDFINVVCVNSKYKRNLDRLRFNPISIQSLTLFPFIQTLFLYSSFDPFIKGINQVQICYPITYKEQQILIRKHKTIKFKFSHIEYNGNENTIEQLFHCKDITHIGDNSFSQNLALKTITLPFHIIDIGNYVFFNCFNLTRIELSNRLTNIGIGCFSGCIGLKHLEIPTNVVYIGSDALFDCTSLESISFPLQIANSLCDQLNVTKSLTSIKIIGKGRIDAFVSQYISHLIEDNNNNIICVNKIFTFYDTQRYGRQIEYGIKEIEDNCFLNDSSLDAIFIPSSVSKIGNNCFSGCTSLTSVSLPPNLKIIGINSFYNVPCVL